MQRKTGLAKDVDEYIALATDSAREKLAALRKIIKRAAPKAEERISYRLPYYTYREHLVGFAAYKDHVSLFGALPKALKKELKTTRREEAAFNFHWTNVYQ